MTVAPSPTFLTATPPLVCRSATAVRGSLRRALLTSCSLCALLAAGCSSSGADSPVGATDAAVDPSLQDVLADLPMPDAPPDAGLPDQDASDATVADAVGDAALDTSVDGPSEGGHDADEGDATGDDAPADADDTDVSPDDSGAWADDSICYFGDFDTDSEQEVACMAWPGPARTKVDLAGLTGGHEIDSITRSPDGKRLAVSGRLSATSPATLVVVRLDGATPPAVVATAASADRTISHPAFSTDGMTLAFLADFDLSGATSLYVTSVGGGVPRRLSPAPSNAAYDVQDFAWSRGAGSRTWIAYVGDLEQDGVAALWAVDTSAAPPAAKAIVPTSTLGGSRYVQAGIQWDLADRVYYRTNVLDSQVWRIHSSDIEATDQRVLTDLVNANGPVSAYSFGVSRAGDRLAFSADSQTTGLQQVFVSPLSAPAPTPTQVSSATALGATGLVLGPSFSAPLRWGASDTTLACVSDWPVATGDQDNVFSVWALSPSQPGQARRLLGAPQSVDQNVREVAFSRSNARVFARGDLVTDGVFELYSTDDLATAGQDPVSRRIEDVPAGGDVLGLEWIP